MASSSFLISLALSLMFAFIGPLISVKRHDIKNACSMTSNPHSCINWIKYDLCPANPNNHSHTNFVISYGYSMAKDIHGDFNAIYAKTRDSKFKFRYFLCSKNYEDAIRAIRGATKELFASGEYELVRVQANDAEEKVSDCKNQIEKSPDKHSFRIRRKVEDFEIHFRQVWVLKFCPAKFFVSR